MTYHLLTGATGLLGSYLLRDCLRKGHRLAVLVRPTKRESGRERIESILSRCEAELRTTLPRPVVIEGELTEADLGMDDAGLRWISRHCCSVIHNAASLTFRGNGRQGEPWHTNVNGTRRVLDLCRDAGIRQFHYISTAYVCGLREGRVLETELDVGQTPGNDYELSKIEAEKLVRAAHWLDPPTVYRPSIIVGDSRTGYTATFHGFYALVKVAHTLVSRMARGSTAGRLLVQGLGLSGKECKNLVPVDWVSAVFTRIFSRPEHHGRTYHLTSRRPPPVTLVADVVQHAVEEYSELADEDDAFLGDNGWFIDSFRQQIEIYRTYWRDDPQFDDTHRAAVAPPCPEMNAAMLLRLAQFAIESNFGKARSRRIRPDFDVHEHIRELPADRRAAGGELEGKPSPGIGRERTRGRPVEAAAPRRPIDGGGRRDRPAVFGRVSTRCRDLPCPGYARVEGCRRGAIRPRGDRRERAEAGPVGRNPSGYRNARIPSGHRAVPSPRSMKRIAITGSSGYLGSCLIRHLAEREPEVRILGLDIVPPKDPGGHEFVKVDMCSSEFAAALKSFQPDTRGPHGLRRAADAQPTEDAGDQRGRQPERAGGDGRRRRRTAAGRLQRHGLRRPTGQSRADGRFLARSGGARVLLRGRQGRTGGDACPVRARASANGRQLSCGRASWAVLTWTTTCGGCSSTCRSSSCWIASTRRSSWCTRTTSRRRFTGFWPLGQPGRTILRRPTCSLFRRLRI